MQRRSKKELARFGRVERPAGSDFPANDGRDESTAGWPLCSLCGDKSQVIYASLPQIDATGIVCEGCALEHGVDLAD